MSAPTTRELVRRQWYVLERLKRLAIERKDLIEEARKASVTLDIKQITRLRAYSQVRLQHMQQEIADLTTESAGLKRSIQAAKTSKAG
jgi:hypothetical protein